MAKVNLGATWKPEPVKKKTSQGKSTNTVFKNKSDKKNKKKYRGQGK